MSLVAAPADRRFRRSHVKPTRRRSRWRTIVRPVAALLVLASVGGLLFFRGEAILARARVLEIDRVTLRGNVRITENAVKARLDGLAGQNLASVDLEPWRARLLSSPWVRDVALRRVLPSTVEVTVTERSPALVGRFAGTLMLVDPEGVLLERFGPGHASLDLPVVDGLDVVTIEPGAQAGAPRMQLVGRVLGSLQQEIAISNRISQIDVTDLHNVHVTLTDDDVVLYVGDTHFVERVRTYLQLSDAMRSSIAEIRYVDLRFGDRIYVGPSGPSRAADAAVTPARPSAERTRRRRGRE